VAVEALVDDGVDRLGYKGAYRDLGAEVKDKAADLTALLSG